MPLSQLPAPSQVPLVPAVMVGMFSLMTPEISSTSGITTDPAATKALTVSSAPVSVAMALGLTELFPAPRLSSPCTPASSQPVGMTQ